MGGIGLAGHTEGAGVVRTRNTMRRDGRWGRAGGRVWELWEGNGTGRGEAGQGWVRWGRVGQWGGGGGGREE